MNVKGESTIHHAQGISKDYSLIKITSANICESYLRLLKESIAQVIQNVDIYGCYRHEK